MGGLAELTFRTSYHKGPDDIAQQFYLPCMRRACEYDRAVGYFRSTVFIIAWPALREFVQRGGRIRILCSQVLAPEDIDALAEGYSARVDDSLASHFLEEVRSFLRDEVLREPARILAALVANGTLDLQVAVLRPTDLDSARNRIFHDKLGIFRDEKGNVVIFKGSMNETWTGLSLDGNLESVDVAATWMGARDRERVHTEDAYFTQLWNDHYPSVSVRPFPQVARHEFVQAADPDWEASVERMLREGEGTAATKPPARSLFPHQAAGLASWKANARQGILAFATGSGKTLTAMTAIREALHECREVVVVVVPDQVLFAQWLREIEGATARQPVRILRAGAGYQRWRDPLRPWTAPGDSPRIVLATVQTAATDEFRRRLTGGKHLMLVADEVHRLGSTRNQRLLDESLFGARLGLSATPERAGDPTGTALLLSFFRGILEPRYSLADAVRDRVLTPYFYRPHVVRLSEDEAQGWHDLAREIGQLQGRLRSGDTTSGLNERVQHLLIRRARIVKHAQAKVPLAVEVLTTEYQRGQRWVVYCEDTSQLRSVSTALSCAGIDNIPFHSQMEGNRTETLKWLDLRGGVVVAIKCLDEGVDVPSVTHALILASSKNPREFIQRRGRVLRTAPNKALAYVHDAIVLPPDRAGADAQDDPITVGELARAVEFAAHADNPTAATVLQRIAVDLGLDWRSLLKTGVEEDEAERSD